MIKLRNAKIFIKVYLYINNIYFIFYNARKCSVVLTIGTTLSLTDLSSPAYDLSFLRATIFHMKESVFMAS